VRDNGPGIPAEHLGQLFEPYFTTRRAGTGLGLPITRNIVESLGGTITVGAGTPGTVVHVDLPEVAPDPQATPARMPA
jgi:signal transduction histidine kinase